MRVASLCSGIGGFDLGLERAGMQIAWQCEIAPYCQHVLAKHWPDVPRYSDLRSLTGFEVAPVDLICAGFPCQPVSIASSTRRAQDDQRWLWPEIFRLCRDLKPRPRWIVLENVPGLLSAGKPRGSAFGEVVADLASLWMDIEWDVLSAGDVGAPHLRKRVWIIARTPMADTNGSRLERRTLLSERPIEHARSGGLADADSAGLVQRRHAESMEEEQRSTERRGTSRRIFDGEIGGIWKPEPSVGRVAHGVPSRVDRLRGLGNAIVPQVAEWIGRRILEAESSQ